MAKMKVHELAKELDKKSKDLIDFLQAKGYEVKAAQSSIEDEAIDLVRRQFGSAKAEEAKEQKAEPRVPEPAAKPAEQKPQEPAGRPRQEQKPKQEQQQNEPPKKKKIIFVSNPHNSKMSGQRPAQGGNSGGGGNRNAGNNRQPGNGGRPVQVQNTPHKIVRPTQKPIPVTAEPYDVRQRQQQERRLEQRQQEKREQNKNAAAPGQGARPMQAQGSRPAPGQGGRPISGQGNRPAPGQGQERTGNAGENRRPEGQNRPAYNNNQGDRGRNGGNVGANRGGAGGERPQRGNGGQDNRFRKGNGPKDFVPEAPVKDIEKHRDEEKRRTNQDRDKRSKKDLIYEEDDAAIKNRNKAGRFIKPEKKAEEKVEEQIKVITISESLTIKELADKMKIQPSVIIKKLFLQGQIVTLNSEISFEDAENIAIEYEIICEKEVKVDVIEELLKEEEEDASTMVARPPVICVMGHVDHGKTSLLDAIRKTNVTDKEAGGITQAIGAYTVSAKGQSITFLDTPGHEAFTAMRMRGANSTDIAVLVVAAYRLNRKKGRLVWLLVKGKLRQKMKEKLWGRLTVDTLPLQRG